MSPLKRYVGIVKDSKFPQNINSSRLIVGWNVLQKSDYKRDLHVQQCRTMIHICWDEDQRQLGNQFSASENSELLPDCSDPYNTSINPWTYMSQIMYVLYLLPCSVIFLGSIAWWYKKLWKSFKEVQKEIFVPDQYKTLQICFPLTFCWSKLGLIQDPTKSMTKEVIDE